MILSRQIFVPFQIMGVFIINLFAIQRDFLFYHKHAHLKSRLECSWGHFDDLCVSKSLHFDLPQRFSDNKVGLKCVLSA
jgi:hypothetical protein